MRLLLYQQWARDPTQVHHYHLFFLPRRRQFQLQMISNSILQFKIQHKIFSPFRMLCFLLLLVVIFSNLFVTIYFLLVRHPFAASSSSLFRVNMYLCSFDSFLLLLLLAMFIVDSSSCLIFLFHRIFLLWSAHKETQMHLNTFSSSSSSPLDLFRPAYFNQYFELSEIKQNLLNKSDSSANDVHCPTRTPLLLLLLLLLENRSAKCNQETFDLFAKKQKRR